MASKPPRPPRPAKSGAATTARADRRLGSGSGHGAGHGSSSGSGSGPGSGSGAGSGAGSGSGSGPGSGSGSGSGPGARVGSRGPAAAGNASAPKSLRKGLRIVRADFVASVLRSGDVPPGPPEFAFVGRSNVGKSSLINALCEREALARTSRTPGRTQRINLFDATLSTGQVVRLVDLPGFGHAEVSKALLAQFSEMIQFWMLASDHLRQVLILQDARRDRDDDAIGFAYWLQENGVDFDVVATKCDAVPKNKLGAVTARLREEFRLPQAPLAVSAHDRVGISELLTRVRNTAFPRPAKKG